MNKIEALIIGSDTGTASISCPDGGRIADNSTVSHAYDVYDARGRRMYKIPMHAVKVVVYELDQDTDALQERIAALVHATWSHWMKYLFD